MTGSCVLCGEVINVEKDNILDELRDARQALEFGKRVRQHIQRKHALEMQDAMNAGMAFSGLVAMSYIHSTEPMFAEDIKVVRDRLMEATKAKEPPSLIQGAPMKKAPPPPGGSIM